MKVTAYHISIYLIFSYIEIFYDALQNCLHLSLVSEFYEFLQEERSTLAAPQLLKFLLQLLKYILQENICN